MKQDIENIIKKNLPEKKEITSLEFALWEKGFNQALSQINTSLIADEVLKVVGNKIKNVIVLLENAEVMSGSKLGIETKNKNIAKSIKLLSNPSYNKENENI